MRKRSLSNLFQCGYPNASPASMVTIESLWSAGIKGNPDTAQTYDWKTAGFPQPKEVSSLIQMFVQLNGIKVLYIYIYISKKESSDSNKCYLDKLKQLGLQSRHLLIYGNLVRRRGISNIFPRFCHCHLVSTNTDLTERKSHSCATTWPVKSFPQKRCFSSTGSVFCFSPSASSKALNLKDNIEILVQRS